MAHAEFMNRVGQHINEGNFPIKNVDDSGEFKKKLAKIKQDFKVFQDPAKASKIYRATQKVEEIKVQMYKNIADVY